MYMPDNKFYRQLQFQLNRSLKKNKLRKMQNIHFKLKIHV